MILINFFLIVGSILDLFLTYKYLGEYKKKFPKKDWTVIEANPLIRYCVKAKGLGEGILVAGTVILFIFVGLINVLPERWKFFLAGTLYMMNVFHLLNFLAIKRIKLEGGKKNSKGKK